MNPIIFDHAQRKVVKVGTTPASIQAWRRLIAAQVRP